ncbi:MAG: hypothetical protein DCF20_09830 [Pseudanabaena sp.]|nr:MAG: hypothetical protein DCF20_09830 [Pseudanabaena sp.]
MIYKTKVFDRWATEQGLTDQSLCQAVKEMNAGLIDADLGGGLYKKRVARTGQGKSGGFRTLVATNRGDRWIFVFGFAKNERDNINKKEQESLKVLANQLLALSKQDLLRMQSKFKLIEVNCHDKIANS